MSAKEHKTLFVAPQRAGPANEAPPPKVSADGSSTSDLTRVRPAYVGAAFGAVGLGIAFFASGPSLGGEEAVGPGPLTPAHVKAKLSCQKCHGDVEQGTDSFKKKAKGACVGCHGPHPSTRAGHKRLAEEGQLGCVTCHTIHGPQSGVRFSEDGPALRYFTNGTQAVPEVRFRSDRTALIPTIPLKVCTASCHTTSADDPLARCRSHAGGGELEPTVCFDEHRLAVPPEAAALAPQPQRRPGVRAPDARSSATPPPLPRSGVCGDQHFEDRSFAWEAAREVVARVPTPPERLGAKSSAGWFGAAAGFALLGYVGAAGVGKLRRRRSKRADAKANPAPAPNAKKRLPVIDTSTCLGCYACVDACPYGVLEVERYVAVAVRPDACCGLDLCEQRCPNGSLVVADEGTVLDRPKLDASLESLDVPGLYLAGDVTGIPLIKNAILQGAHAAERAQRALSSRPRAEGAHDVCIIGAGPAGISAALRLQELGADAIVIEQGGVAQSIQNFPRGKLVFDQPLELPVEGKLWLKESSKEELLLHWMRIVRQKGLRIREQTRMTSVERLPNGIFTVKAVQDEAEPCEIRARTIVLAVGTRGSPRKLPVPIPTEAEAKVHYHLADARSLAGRRILVIGLGDSAMEAAIAMAGQPRTSVTILARAGTYARGQARNIAEVERLRKAKRLDVRFGIEINEVHDGWLVCGPIAGAQKQPSSPAPRSEKLPFEAMFVLIGTIPPWDTLRRAGLSPSQLNPVGTMLPTSVFKMNPAAPAPATPPEKNQS